ncbi:hypothetical protein AcV7_006990 [Taiwanofungus camphoratus]|nr:hypothetical protein AcV7_006990 [Antrodia cinnamomea]
MVCNWLTEKDSPKHISIQRAFHDIDQSQSYLDRRCISRLILFENGQQTSTALVSHSSKKPKHDKKSTPFISLSKPTLAGAQLLPEVGKAPKPATTISLARKSVSPLSRTALSQGHHQPVVRGTRSGPAGHMLDEKQRRVDGPDSKADAEAMNKLVAAQEALLRLSKSMATQTGQQGDSVKSMLTLEPGTIPEHLPIFPKETTSASLANLKAPPPGILPASYPLPFPGSEPMNDRELTNGPRDKVQHMTRTLWNVRRQITALKAQEDVIVDNLRQLGAQHAPDVSGNNTANEAENEQVLRKEITNLRTQLERECAARRVAETALEKERHQRMHTEAILGDVRRECSMPFVVPALMDAFVKLAQLTGDVPGGACIDS